MLIDTHAHINMLHNPGQGIIEAREAGVKEIIIPSASEDDFEAILELCHEFDDVYALLGVHPEDCEKFSDKTAKKIIDLSKDEKVKGIGEIGLDYYYIKGAGGAFAEKDPKHCNGDVEISDFLRSKEENKEIQKHCFINQIEIAKMLNLPIVVHDRDAHFDVLEILKSQNVKNVLLHCFSGSVEFMRECTNLGYKIAIGGVVTFKNAKNIKEVALEIDLDDLVLETDCPYLTPHPFRGLENSPKYIGFVAKEIANIKNISYEDVVLKTSNNAKKFFNLD